MAERHGIERLGFLTLTFADHVLDAAEASRRKNSLVTHVIRPRYGSALWVVERQKSGRIHYHLVVALEQDIRTGVDFAAIARRDYRTAGAALRSEWAFWRRTAPAYGFGRTELLPVMSTAAAISRYVGKYIGKHLEARQEADHGVRLVGTVGPKVATTKFGWVSPRAAEWRARAQAFADMLHGAGAILAPTPEGMRLKFGKRWAWQWRDSIATFPLDAETPLQYDRFTEAAEG